MCYLQETYLRFKDTNRLEPKNGKRYQSNSNHQKAGVALLILDKTELKKITREKQAYFTLLKILTHKEDVAIINIQHEAQTDRIGGRNRQSTNNNGRF